MVFSTFCHFVTISGQLTARCRKKQVANRVTAKKIGGARNVRMVWLASRNQSVQMRYFHEAPKIIV
jgi:hypothetical protein